VQEITSGNREKAASTSIARVLQLGLVQARLQITPRLGPVSSEIGIATAPMPSKNGSRLIAYLFR
jgi:hypothetical protein